MQEDMQMVGSLQVEVYVCQVGALEQDTMKKKLNGAQARPGSDCSNEPKEEITYLKRIVKSKHK